jgi:hypothetical protein
MQPALAHGIALQQGTAAGYQPNRIAAGVGVYTEKSLAHNGTKEYIFI